jgi:hypothetical protein
MTHFALDLGVWAVVLSISVCDGLAQSLMYYNAVAASMKVTLR